MSYTKQTAQESQRIESGANKVVSPKFTDQRASTSVQLKQQEMMGAVQRVEDEELLQGKFETAQRAEDEELLQGKFATTQLAEDEEMLQGKFSNSNTTQLEEKPNNTGLPNQLKSGIESLSGMSMDNVKVHYNSDKPAQLNAHAYAQGTDIHVAPGQEQHLPHEAWHVVQQAQGRVQPTTQMKGTSVNDDVGLESEADVMGAKALATQTKSAQLKEDTKATVTTQLKSLVAQLQQTKVCLKSATGTYTDANGTAQAFAFQQSSKGSDVLFTTKSHPGHIDYSEQVIAYLKKQNEIPSTATNVVLTAHDTYGIKL